MKKQILKTALAVAALAGSLAAYAQPTLFITDGVTTAGPINGAGGSVIYANPLFGDNWSVVITAGESKPLIGSATSPNMELDIQATSTGPGNNLSIALSDNNFGPVFGSFTALLDSHVVSGSGDSMTFNTYYDAGNGLLALTTPLTSSGPLSGNNSGATFPGGTIGANPFSLTEVVTLGSGAAGGVAYSIGANLQSSCPCTPHDIQYNFNGTQIIFQPTSGGSYVWFISDGTVNGVPSNQKTLLHISSQTITIPASGSSPQYIIPVPDAYITFDPSVTVATTTFDTVNNVWRMTFPPSGLSGNVFYGGVAFKVPAAGLPGGIKNVNWSGQFTTATSGLSIHWQWSAAAYSDFTANYNALMVKPTDDNQKSAYQNSDHAGTPEGTDSVSGKLWKSFVIGGASGGGGGNYTGSGSSTIQFPPCVCPGASPD